MPAQPTNEGFALTNFAKVSDEIYRSGQFDEKQLEYLVQHYGIKSVIKLNGGKDPVNSPLVKAPHIPGWSVVVGRYCPTTERIKEILDAIDCAPKPVLIHCLHGEDRTGLIVALWRIRHGATVAEAHADMMKRGFHTNYPGVWKAWSRETGWGNTDAEAALSAALASKPICPGLSIESAAADATSEPIPSAGTAASTAKISAPAGAM